MHLFSLQFQLHLYLKTRLIDWWWIQVKNDCFVGILNSFSLTPSQCLSLPWCAAFHLSFHNLINLEWQVCLIDLIISNCIMLISITTDVTIVEWRTINISRDTNGEQNTAQLNICGFHEVFGEKTVFFGLCFHHYQSVSRIHSISQNIAHRMLLSRWINN